LDFQAQQEQRVYHKAKVPQKRLYGMVDFGRAFAPYQPNYSGVFLACISKKNFCFYFCS
jgi:hypothetical protein